MKEIIKKIAVPFASAIFGGLAVIAAFKLSPSIRYKMNVNQDSIHHDEQVYDDIAKKQEGIRSQFDDLFREDFLVQNDPFEEMKKMRNQMERHMERLHGKNRSKESPFDAWFSDKFGGGSINNISKREDDDFVYYDVNVDDVNATSINAKVESGYVTITGAIENKSDSEEKDKGFTSHNVFKSSFDRTFPLPENIDANKMQMLTEKDKIILKFPKIKV